jgi:hypothetical protein
MSNPLFVKAIARGASGPASQTASKCKRPARTLAPPAIVSLVTVAWLLLVGQLCAQTVTLTGVSNNQILTNGQKVILTASVTGTSGDHQTLSIYDSNKFVFGRPFSSAAVGSEYSMQFEWFDLPLGPHALQARRIEISPTTGQPIRTNVSAVINIRVVGRTFGFASVTNMFTSPSPEQPGTQTTFGCRLEVRNQTGAPSNPLRVRLLTTQTYYYVTNDFAPAPATNTIPFVETTNSAVFGAGIDVGTNASIFISIPSNNICPAAFDGGQFGEAHVQSHVYALLEEQLVSGTMTNWAVVDTARLIYSILENWSSDWNSQAKGINPPGSDNRIARPISLVIAGPTNIVGGNTAAYFGLAGFSDKSTGAVSCVWTASSQLLTINSNGQATASTITTNATVGIGASYSRVQPPLVAAKTVTITPPPTVTLSGVANNSTLVNGQQIHLSASAASIEHDGKLSIYDGNTFLFARSFNTNVVSSSYTIVFDWTDPPLGNHALQAVLVQNGSGTFITNKSSIINFQVTGRAFGFASISNLFMNPTPQKANLDTIFGCKLEIRNQTAATSNPLRVRLLTTQTYYYVTNDFNQPPVINTIPFTEVTNSTSLASNFTVGASTSFFVNVSSNQVCPRSTPDVSVFPDPAVQSHVYAILEEQIGSKWSIVDTAQIIFSILPDMFPENDGAIAMNPLTTTNRIAYPTNMVISGPTNLNGGSATSFLAVATLSDTAMGTVIPTWTSSSPFLTVNTNGMAMASSTTSNVTVSLIASYTRSFVTAMATQRVTILETVIPPSITSPLQNEVVALGSNTTFTVAASGTQPLSYSWRFNTMPISGATSASYTVTNSQAGNAGPYIVTITNRGGSISSTGMLSVASRPILSARYLQNNNSVELTLTTTPGHNCIIDVSTNLIAWTNFITLPNPAGQTILSDSATPPRRFYRARVTN